jgi:hypothetical protein
MMFRKYCISTNVAKWGPYFVILSKTDGLDMLEGCCRCRVCRCCCGGCVVGVVGGIVAVVSCMVYWIIPPKEAGKTEEKGTCINCNT